MAFESVSVWAIDIGNNSLKALHLSIASGAVEVIGFENIQHGKILAGSGVKAAEKDELIALSLRQFVKQNDLGNEPVVVSVPSQNSFARFVKLPPVEQKRIPEIVRFEAAQQIPFDINDVQWDWQLMTEADSPETKVGIFAIKNEVVASMLEHFGGENITVSYVQMAPMALYNYALYDRSDSIKSDAQATVILDIGAENSDLVVCTKSTVWQRAIPMGGNAFTRAIADAFKLNFEKAEKLKRTAAMSKYARQIFQAMRPVFTDLASEIQRSLGFYKTSNPDTKLAKIIALGGGSKMRGLSKYLQQTLQIPIEMPDSFEKLAISSAVSVAKFHENVCDFGIVYGLALQSLGLARIESNLLPRSIARSMAWASKTKYFTLTACMLLLVSVLSFGRTLFVDKAKYARNERIRRSAAGVISTARQASSKLEEQKGKASASKKIIEKEFDYFKYRDVVPLLHQTLMSVLPDEENNPEQSELYKAFAGGDVEAVKEIPRKERKQIFVTSMSVRFVTDIAVADFGAMDFVRLTGGGRRGRPGVGSPDVTGMPFMPGMPLMPGMPGMPGMPTGPRSRSTRKYSRRGKEGGLSKDTDKGGPGFVVTITG
ncbi:MAG: type IV pilus assembly protein PilM, partial [Planctomycetota bacterium]